MTVFVIAMDKEAAPVIARMTKVKERKICGKRVIFGGLFKKKTAIVVCGVGKANAACGAAIAISALKGDKIINLGVAGGLNDKLKVAQIYEISHAVQYDFDLTRLNGTEIGTLDECNENYIPLDICGRYPQIRLATGDRFNDSKTDFLLLTNTLQADIRDMEGGAIAQVCMNAGVECVSFKIISDVAGGESATTEQYLKNLEKCFETLARELKNIAEEM